MNDLDDARELLMTLKRTLSSNTDQSVITALQILLRDYIERTSKAKRDAERLTSL